MSYQYQDAQGNHYVRGWGNDFTEEERRELGIGEFNTGPERGPGKISIDKRIEDLFSRLPTSTGWPEGGTTIKDPRTPDPGLLPTDSWPAVDYLQALPGGRVNQAPRPEGIQRVATGIADWLTGNKWDLDQRGGSGIPRGRGQYDPQDRIATTMMGRHPDGTPVTFDNPYRKSDSPLTPLGPAKEVELTPIGPAKAGELTPIGLGDGTYAGAPSVKKALLEVPIPPLEKTLEQRVWERDQMPARTPDAQGRLYPDKSDPGFIDPRVSGDGRMTMQYIPELDDPNWTPWKNYGPGWSREQDWNKGGEGVQYRM
jgi:hypothetical protein